MLAVVAVAVSFVGATLLVAPTAAAANPGEILSPGPLERIAISSDLNCDVRYLGDTEPEFYAGIACGTFVATGGELFGPANVPAGGSASPRTGFTAISQEGPTGEGTSADPWVVTTTVDLGEDGLRLEQVDTYVGGRQSYSTRMRLVNTSDAAATAIVYRAGDCYVANSDYGFGAASEGSVACVSPEGRVAKWIPVTGGSAYIEAEYHEVWAAVGSQQMFPNTTRGDENIDNGAGLSWQVEIPADDEAVVSHVTAFSDSEQAADEDGDGLLDDWERDGLDVDGDGTPEVDLPAMGARVDHKDLFVEVDWMDDPRECFLWWCWGGRDFRPQQDALDDVRAAMAAAPVSNPDGTTGIRLHIDSGPDSVMNPDDDATWDTLSRASAVDHTASLGSNGADGYDWSDFNTLKGENFDPERADVFHYALFADTYAGSGSSGIAQVTDDPWEGDSFLVTDGGSGWGGGFSRRQESGTFMHEFGHTLGLRHGGGTHENFKPNYLSIMSYYWQLGTRPLDYSPSDLVTLDENDLVEANGLPGATGMFAWHCPDGDRRNSTAADEVDWDCDDSIDEDPVSVDVNDSPDGALSALEGYDDWANIVFDGGAVGAFGVGDLNDQNPPIRFSPDRELTHDQLAARDLAAAPGDGSVAVEGPYVLLPGVSGQAVDLRVHNAGATTAAYRTTASGVTGVSTQAEVAAVPGYGSAQVKLQVDGALLQPGRHTLTVELTAAGGGSTLATTTAEILVPDLSDPAVRAQAEQILEALRTPRPGLDESLRGRALEALTDSLRSAVSLVALSGDGQSAVVGGEQFSDPLSVEVRDAAGSTIPQAAVQFRVVEGSATFEGGASTADVRAGTNGVATSPLLSTGSQSGPITVVATSGAATTTFVLLATPSGTDTRNLRVALSAPSRAAQGTTFSLVVTVTNTGTTPMRDIDTSVFVPRSATVQAPQGAVSTGARVRLMTAALEPGQTVTHTFSVTTGSNGVLPLTAVAVSADPEADSEDNWAQVTVER